MKRISALIFILFAQICIAKSEGSRIIPQGRFAPLYGIEKNQTDFLIKTFSLDLYPVTMDDFNLFLVKYPEWKKENTRALYADKNYLTKKKYTKRSPVVFISWFAANAFCESKKGRLPSTLEWEYVATPKNSTELDKILAWYSRPENDDESVEIGKDKANSFGIFDLHGLIWEWTSDFNSVIMTSDNRDDGDKNNGLFCGAGSIGARTREDYAGFIRYSLRSSLEANYTLTNLGFRCAYDL
ncbi:MAG: formylglycine-generating enzyme family protein [Bdellovibrionales bacterium]|nr:formylglycine-generating enzyme family protein [Bdellovibrionales bacterium]